MSGAMIPAQITSGSTVYVHRSINSGDYYCLQGAEEDPAHQWKYNVAKNQNNTVYFSNKGSSSGSVWVLPDLNAAEGDGDPVMVTSGEVPRTVRAKSGSNATASVAGSVNPSPSAAVAASASAAAAAAATATTTTSATSSVLDVRARLQEQIKARLQKQLGESAGGGGSADAARAAATPSPTPAAADVASTPNSKLDTTQVELSPLTNVDGALSPRRMDDVTAADDNADNEGDDTLRSAASTQKRSATASGEGGAATRTVSRLEALRQKRSASANANSEATPVRGTTPTGGGASPSPSVMNGGYGAESPLQQNGVGGSSESVHDASIASSGKMSARERLALYRQKKAGGGTTPGQSTPRGSSLTPTEFGGMGGGGGGGGGDHSLQNLHGASEQRLDSRSPAAQPIGEGQQQYPTQQQRQLAVPTPTTVANANTNGSDVDPYAALEQQFNMNTTTMNTDANTVVVSGGTSTMHHTTAAAILAEKQQQLLLDDEQLQRDKADLVKAERLAIEHRRRALAVKAAEEEALRAALESRRRMEEERLAMDQRAMEERLLRLKQRSVSRGGLNDDDEDNGTDAGGDGGYDVNVNAAGSSLADRTAIALDAGRRLEEERKRFAAAQSANQRKADIARSRALSYSDAVAETLRIAVEEQAEERERQRAAKEAALAEERERIEIAMAQRLSAADEAYLAVENVGGANGNGDGAATIAAAAADKPTRYPKALMIPYSSTYRYIGSAMLNPQQYQARAMLDAAGLLQQGGGGSGTCSGPNANASSIGLSATSGPINTSRHNGSSTPAQQHHYQQQQQQQARQNMNNAPADSALSRFLQSTDRFISNSSSRAVLASAGAMANPRGGLVSSSPQRGRVAAAGAADTQQQAAPLTSLKDRQSIKYVKDGYGVMYYNANGKGGGGGGATATAAGRGGGGATASDGQQQQPPIHDISILDSYAKAMVRATDAAAGGGGGEGEGGVDGGTSANPFRVLEALSFYEGEWEDDKHHGIGTLSAPSAAYHGAFTKGKVDGRGTLQTRRLYASADFVNGAAKGTAVVETSAGEAFAGVIERNKVTTPGSLTLAAPVQQQQRGAHDPPQAAIPSASDTMEWVWGSPPPNPSSGGAANSNTAAASGHTMGTGQARIRYANGDLYVGPVLEYKPHGAEGCYRFKDGTCYTGAFTEGVISGRGVYRFQSGNVYEGEVKEGVFHGKGTYTRVDEFIYDGMWADGKMHGAARVTFGNGDVWEGSFVKDIKGPGRYVKSAQFLLAPPTAAA